MTTTSDLKMLLTPPPRRAVKELALQISEFTDGALIGATMNDPIFGVYVIWGKISRASHGDYVIGAQSVESNGKPVAPLIRLDNSGHVTPAVGDVSQVATLTHGTIVRATFDRRGEVVTVVGPAILATESPMFGVGHWILSYKETIGRYLNALDVLAGAEGMGMRPPAPMVSWNDADAPASAL